MGLLILLGVAAEDTEKDGAWLASKLANLRIFADDDGRMNASLLDIDGGAGFDKVVVLGTEADDAFVITDAGRPQKRKPTSFTATLGARTCCSEKRSESRVTLDVGPQGGAVVAVAQHHIAGLAVAVAVLEGLVTDHALGEQTGKRLIRRLGQRIAAHHIANAPSPDRSSSIHTSQA